MSQTKGISDDSSITSINNEHQDDVQTSPPLMAKTLFTDSDIHGVLVSKADPKKSELPGEPPNHLDEQEREGKVRVWELNLVAVLFGIVDHEILIDIVTRQVTFLSNVRGCSYKRCWTPEYVPKVERMIEKLSRGCKLDEIISGEKDLVFLRKLLEHILDSEIVSSSRDIHGVLVSKVDPKKNELLGKPSSHVDEQEPEGEVHGVLDLAAILLGIVGHENLIAIILRQVTFLSNVGGCSHHRHRTPEYVPKVGEIIDKLLRGSGMDEIIVEEKDPVFLRQLLEHILDSEIISSSIDAQNGSASRPDAVLEALVAAPCHSRASANLPAHICEEDA